MVLPPPDADRLQRIPAVPESTLPDAVLARLPLDVPSPPWRNTFDGFAWVQRAGAGAADLLPAALRGRMAPRWVLGSLVRYTESPVGPYSELMGALLLRSGRQLGAHVPFMAVDSLASVRGGRVHWAMPKTLAAFDGDLAAGGNLRASGDGWRIEVRARPVGPLLRARVRMPLRCAQVRPDGTVARFTTTFTGPVGLAVVDVAVASGASLPAWLPPGRHLGTRWSGAVLDSPVPTSRAQ